MTQREAQLVLNDAPSQYERRLAALRRDFARVDGRSFSDLLDFAVRYAELINFYDLRNEVDGDWVPFFVADPTMAAAALAAFDADAAEARVEGELRAAREARDQESARARLVAAATLVLGQARLLNACFDGLREARGAAAALLRREIESEITGGLGARLRALRAWDAGAADARALGRALGLDWSGFLPLWELGDGGRADRSPWRGRTPLRRLTRGVARVGDVGDAFASALRSLGGLARRDLRATLRRDDHAPQLGLYMAFARLFRHAQRTLNTYGRRYARFYFRDVLRGAPRGPLPDTTWLTFALADDEDVTSATVPQGTLFPAGQDAQGREVVFASDAALRVTDARLERLLMLRRGWGALFEPLPGGDGAPALAPAVAAPVVRALLASEVALDATSDDDGAPVAWTTFGADAPGASGAQTTRTATLGFALASEYLALSGGRRTVTLTFTLPPGARRDALNARLDAIAAATGLDSGSVFRSVAAACFRLLLSSAEGFFELQSYECPPPASEETQVTQFRLRFTLTEGAPPVTALPPADEDAAAEAEIDLLAPPPPDPAPGLPTLEGFLRQADVTVAGPSASVRVAPLPLFAEVELGGVTLEVDVTALTGLTVETSDGETDTGQPFTVFGGLPVVGSYLRVRHAELFAKRLSRLDLGLRWFGLPTQATGFAGYYRDYVLGDDGQPLVPRYDNAVFRGALRVLQPGLWELPAPDPERPVIEVELFRTLDPGHPEACSPAPPAPEGPLCPRSDFGPYVPVTHQPPDYYDPAQSAIQLELRGPRNAFGNDIYGINVVRAVVEDLPDGDVCEAACQARWAIYDETARALADALAHCADTPDDQFRACIEPQIAACVALLVTQAVTRFLACVGTCPIDVTGASDAFATRVQACLSAPPAEGARALRELLAAPGLDPCRAGCAAQALPLVEAALRIVAALLVCRPTSPDYKPCAMAALADLQAWFATTYSDGLKACIQACMRPGQDLHYPNEPWLPQAEALDVGYAASCDADQGGAAAPALRFFHLTPFGGFEQRPLRGATPLLLPRGEADGSAYLGFGGSLPGRPLTLFSQLVAARGESDLPPVAWSYLARDAWRALTPGQVPSDTTGGLRHTGVVTLALPDFEAAAHTVMPAGWQWLAVSVTAGAGAFPATCALLPHATTATWVDDGAGGARLVEPLPAHTITSSVQDLPDIGEVNQPVASFGGRPGESGRAFETRLSERLRHKERALLGWDYERLVLERFPGVWKTRALPAHDARRAGAPGHVLLMVVAGPHGVATQDPTAPLAPGELLAAIRSFLSARTSPFVRLDVVNPVYVRVKVSAELRLREGVDAGGALDRLDAELVRYLSPWFYDAARAARGGQYASQDDIVEFLQTRPEVESVTRTVCEYDPRPEDLETDWYFLTSAASHDLREAGNISPCDEQAG